jgi:uncharacterized protein YijF (DUF1287 family)
MRLSFFVFLFLFLSGFTTFWAEQPLGERIAYAAQSQIGVTIFYDGAYQRLDYPGGDVPMETGVCTDVVIRALRTVGMDLQKLVHVDMKKNFKHYPQNWGLKKPDKNIDHRRVPNLMKWFERHGWEVKSSNQKFKNFRTGDLVTWKLPGGLWHIGVVSSRRSLLNGNKLIVHNFGDGVVFEDVLNLFPKVGHYRYPSKKKS